MKAKFLRSEKLTDTITSFWFKLEDPVLYTAGQYVEMHLPHQNPDSRGTRRWFTLCTSPDELPMISITTEIVTDCSSFKKALVALGPDQEVNLTSPIGDFVLPKIIQTPLIFVAGGIGITPFHSILSWLANSSEQRSIKIIYWVENEDEIIFQDTFKKAGVEPVIVVQQPSDEWGGETGDLSADLILGVDQPSSDTLIYLSGPELMLEKIQKDLISRGIQRSQLVLDFFPGYNSTRS
jgi:ferredoxin-NADP reductase